MLLHILLTCITDRRFELLNDKLFVLAVFGHAKEIRFFVEICNYFESLVIGMFPIASSLGRHRVKGRLGCLFWRDRGNCQDSCPVLQAKKIF